MKICEKCFTDETLHNIVYDRGEPGQCDLCGEDSAHVYDTETQDELTPYFEQIVQIYQPYTPQNTAIPQSETVLLQTFIARNWNIFREGLAEGNINEALMAICPDLYNLDNRLFVAKVYLRNAYNPEYLERHSVLRRSWEEFEKDIKGVNRFHSRQINLAILKKYFSYLRLNLAKGDIFYRSRIGGSKPFSKDKMGAPPVENTMDNRVSARGIRCLYLGDSESTTLYETRAAKYDYVSVGKFELQQDISVVDLTGIKNISPFILPDDGDIEELAVNMKHFMKIDRALGAAVRRTDSALDYVPTQYIADYIKSIEDEKTHEQIYQGIKYKSVMHPGGYNLAIFVPELFRCEDVQLRKIKEVHYQV